MQHWELETDQGIYFWGGVLSNWYKSEFVDNSGTKFNCAEQYMMKVKADLFNDKEVAEKIMNTKDPKKQKALGRSVKGYSDDLWDLVARDEVFVGVLFKFYQNEDLKNILLSTSDKLLVEASPYDKKWGIGLRYNSPLIHDKSKWQGTNWLGQILMKTRDVIRDPNCIINPWSKYE